MSLRNKRILFYMLLVVVLHCNGQYNITNFRSNKDGLVFNNVRAITQDKSGTLWIGTTFGLCSFDGREWKKYTPDEDVELPSQIITALFTDKENNVWVGTWCGLSCFNGVSWKTYSHTERIPSCRINSITESNDKSPLVASVCGSYVFHYGAFTRVCKRFAYSVVQENDDDYLNGLYAGKVFELHGRYKTKYRNGGIHYNTRFPVLFLPPLGFILPNRSRVVKMAKDAKDKIWVASLGCGLFVKERDGWINFGKQTRLDCSRQATAVMVDNHGNVWVGSTSGIHIYKNGAWISIGRNEGLAGNVVNAIFDDRDENIWVGTTKGLSKIIMAKS